MGLFFESLRATIGAVVLDKRTTAREVEHKKAAARSKARVANSAAGVEGKALLSLQR